MVDEATDGYLECILRNWMHEYLREAENAKYWQKQFEQAASVIEAAELLARLSSEPGESADIEAAFRDLRKALKVLRQQTANCNHNWVHHVTDCLLCTKCGALNEFVRKPHGPS